MAFEEMHRRQQAIAARRRKNKKKFSLLLSPISVPTTNSAYEKNTMMNNRSRMKCAALFFAPFLAMLLLLFNRRPAPPPPDRSTVRNKYFKANMIEHKPAEEVTSDERGDLLSKFAARSKRAFKYIGDFDPAKPKPWPKEQKDWWSLHETLARRVRESDASSPLEFDVDEESRLPQLVFFGDSITEGWTGRSFGNVPGEHRMWKDGEDGEIRKVFEDNFGKGSKWGRRALKPPLVLGISGSATYDMLWRIENGEFPTSRLLDLREEGEVGDKAEEEQEEAPKTFRLEKLERIYIVLMGTNNLGGGMLPGPTLLGMDAVARAVLRRHEDEFPDGPRAALLFSELLPRRDDFRAAKMCPPRCKNVTALEPYESFSPAIEKVNRGLPRLAEGWRRDFPRSRVVLLSGSSGEDVDAKKKDRGNGNGDERSVDESTDPMDYTMTINCGRKMFVMDDEDEFDEYMPDRLHPNAKGYALWGSCLKSGLEVIMDHSIILTER